VPALLALVFFVVSTPLWLPPVVIAIRRDGFGYWRRLFHTAELLHQ
jgi:hypothetical protein